jgi:hypothetical protein
VSRFTSLSGQKVKQGHTGRLGEPAALQPVPMVVNRKVRSSNLCIILQLVGRPAANCYSARWITDLQHGATQPRLIEEITDYPEQNPPDSL